MNTNSQDVLEVTAYPISAYEINIDFSHVPENIQFTYYVNGEEKENYQNKEPIRLHTNSKIQQK